MFPCSDPFRLLPPVGDCDVDGSGLPVLPCCQEQVSWGRIGLVRHRNLTLDTLAVRGQEVE